MMRKYCYRLALIMWLVGLVACTSGTAPASNPEPSSPMIDPIGPPSSAVEGVSDDEIVIGVSAAFSGPSQGLGVELYRGAMAYLEEVNANGGVNGRRISLRIYDDGYNPNPAINNTISLVENDNVFLLFNYVGTPTVTRVLPLLKLYEDRSMVMLFPFSGAEPQRQPPFGEYVFNLRASYLEETAGLVQNFLNINRRRIALLYQADAYGRSGWDGVRRALNGYGTDIVAEATYRRNADFSESFQPQVNILRAANPDAIIIIGSYEAAAGFIRDARDSGLDVPMANVSFVGSENLLAHLQQAGSENGRDYTVNLINSQVVPSYEDTTLTAVREYRALIDKYNPQFPNETVQASYTPLPYSFVSFEGFLNAKILVELLSRLGEQPRRENIDDVLDAMNNLNLGINTTVSYAENKHQGLDTVYYTVLQDGKFIPLTSWEEWKK
ncbi:MAG: ABC transporter substrate-binding protein [Candidatus Promineifilaceae bacterium]